MAENPETIVPAKKSKISWIRTGGTIISILLFIWLMVSFGWQELLESISKISIGTILFTLFLALFSRFAISMRWYFLCRSNAINIPVKDALEITFAGLYASNFLPSTIGGDVVRYLGAIQLDGKKVKCAGSLIMDRLVGMFGMALVLPIGLVRLIPVLLAGNSETGMPNMLDSAVLVLPAALSKILQKSKKAFVELLNQIRDWVMHPSTLLSPIFMTFIHMLLLFVIVDLIFSGLGDQVSFWLIS